MTKCENGSWSLGTEEGMSTSKGKAANWAALGVLLAMASCGVAGLALMSGLALLGALEVSPGAWIGCSLLMLALKLASSEAGVTVKVGGDGR